MADQGTVFSERQALVRGGVGAGSVPWSVSYLRRASLIDGMSAVAAGTFTYVLRLREVSHITGVYLGLTVLLPFVWVILVRLSGACDPRFIGVGTEEFRKVLNAGAFLAGAVAVVAFASRSELSRAYVFVALPTVTVVSLTGRYALRKRLHQARGRGQYMSRVVVIGHASLVADLAAMLRRDTYHGLRVVAACVTGPDRPAEIASLGDLPVVVGADDVGAVVRQFGADTVAVVASPEMAGSRLRTLAWELEKTGTELCVAPALLDVAGPRTTIRPVAGLPLLHLDHPEFSGGRQVVKEAFDKAFALFAVVVGAPVLGLIAAIIKLDDGGPVLFRQTRVGQNGERFAVVKFRTMVPDAEDRKADLAGLNEIQGPLFKIRADPRVTRAGRWLRRYSLDELPQLFNVIAGDMSLVGPRPALPDEAALYGDYVRRRLAVKPGMTGLWQVSGRSDLSWDESVRLDLRYVENWSLVLDLQILWKTLAAVVRGSGAY